MENSILTSTKKILGITEDDTSFDLDVITHINSVFSILSQLGIPEGGFYIEDKQPVWDDLGLPDEQMRMVRTYMYLKVRMLFDPPGTSFVIEAMNNQIQEHEHRLTYFREGMMT